MSRILFWLALALLVLFALRSKWRALQSRQTPPPQKALPEAEAMLCCARCGIHYPLSETVKANGQDYCSLAHAQLPAP